MTQHVKGSDIKSDPIKEPSFQAGFSTCLEESFYELQFPFNLFYRVSQKFLYIGEINTFWQNVTLFIEHPLHGSYFFVNTQRQQI